MRARAGQSLLDFVFCDPSQNVHAALELQVDDDGMGNINVHMGVNLTTKCRNIICDICLT